MNVTPDEIAMRPGRSRWHARPVVVLNWLALVLTIGLFTTFLLQAGVFDMFTSDKNAEPPKDLTQEKVVVKASSLNGFDREEQPYTIDSMSAAQDPDKPNLIYLSAVTGKLRKASGQIITIAADNGRYDSQVQTLDLQGNVQIILPDRFVAKMPTARITLENKELFTEDHVVVTLKSGDISANGLKIVDDGKNITFLNRVKARLQRASDKENKQ